MRRGLALLLVAGCNQVLGIHGTHKPDAAGMELCDPLPFDAARYLPLNYPAVGFGWAGARVACQEQGFDLAVIDMNDTAEITNELTGAALPFWLGVSYDGTQWSAIDTCPPVLAWAMGEPANLAIGECVFQSAGGMRERGCTEMTDLSGVGLSALCETLRPSPACRSAAMQRDYVVASKTPVVHSTAEQMCSDLGRHLVEIDSSDELSFVSQNHADVPDFWIGARRAGGMFTSPTSCPQIFTWSSGEPTGSPQDCVYYAGGMHADYCDSDSHAVICEAN